MEIKHLNHSSWCCKYHAVWIPKCRKKKIFTSLRPELGEIFHELARQKESVIEEWHLLPDHVHILISIPPKLAVDSVLGYLKGKSAIYIARNFCGKPKNFIGENFWARGYYVSTVGLDEENVRKYIQNQEKEDQRQEALRLW